MVPCTYNPCTLEAEAQDCYKVEVNLDYTVSDQPGLCIETLSQKYGR